MQANSSRAVSAGASRIRCSGAGGEVRLRGLVVFCWWGWVKERRLSPKNLTVRFLESLAKLIFAKVRCSLWIVVISLKSLLATTRHAFSHETNATRRLPLECHVARDVLQPFHQGIHVKKAIFQHTLVVGV